MKKIICSLIFIAALSLSFGQTTFEPKTLISTTGSFPYRVNSGFINDDEYPDFVVATFGGGNIELYLNDYPLNNFLSFQPKVATTKSGYSSSLMNPELTL
jgi:hypothetical protein